MKSFFTPSDVVEIVGITYRQIQYWDATHFIKPSYRRKGRYRLYTFSDLIQLKLAKKLRDYGYSIQRLRKVIKSLRSLLPQVNHPLVDLTFLIEGERILIFNGHVLMANVFVGDYIVFQVFKLRDEVDVLFPESATFLDEDRAADTVTCISRSS